MSIGSADEVIALIKSGKYENAVNARRGVGRTSLSEADKTKVAAFINKFFGEEGATAKPAKKAAKRAAKKASKKVARAAATTPPKAGKKKATRKAAAAPAEEAPGTVPISPTEVDSVASMLTLIDSTVSKSVSIINALQRAEELSKTGDITAGVSKVKEALVGAAQLLHKSVLSPLQNTHAQSDPETTARLAQVVHASNNVAEQMGANSFIPEIPPPPALPTIAEA